MVEPPASNIAVSSQEQRSNSVGGFGGEEQQRPGGDATAEVTTATMAATDNASAAAAAQPSPSTAPLSEDEKPLCVLVIGEWREGKKYKRRRESRKR